MYDTDGRLIQSKELDFNVTHAVQDEDSVVFAYENGTLAVYDWNKDQLVEEKENFGVVKAMTKGERMIVTGGERGELIMLKHNQ